jgi:glycosyltransferase involved in cell wall biosynthesis
MTSKCIAILAPIGLPIPPKKQGGIESVVYELTQSLVQKGHQVLLFAPKTTKTSAKLVPICSRPIASYKGLAGFETSRPLRLELSILTNVLIQVLKRKKQIALVFNHAVDGGLFAPLESMTGLAVYHTLHTPLFPELADVYKNFKARLISIAAHQRKSFPGLKYATTIYNGINLKKFPFSDRHKNYLLFAGKIRPAKNPLAAILAAKEIGAKLLLAGKISDKTYFEKEIKPLLDRKIIYLGELKFKSLLKVYAGAKALLCPSAWAEPFGLTMVEAQACGTPVIAFDKGSAHEVVQDKKTGFVIKNISQMIKAVEKIDNIKREDCRTWVEKNFSVEKMVEGYEKVYYQILNAKIKK